MNVSAIDLNLLPVLEALLEERSVSRAARRVGLSQPALSNALSRLRAATGDELFQRQGRAMQPTPLALELGAGVSAGMAQIRAAFRRDTAFDPALSRRVFRVGMADSTEWRLGGALAARICVESPGVRVQVRRLEELFGVPEADLRAGSLDLAVGYFPDSRALPQGLASETLGEEENRVVIRKGHPALKDEWTERLFASLDHAAIIYRSELWGLVDAELASRALRRKVRFASPHFLPVLKAVSESDLVACVPESVADGLAETLGLTKLPVPFAMPPFVTRMVWNQHHTENMEQLWFRSVLRGSFH